MAEVFNRTLPYNDVDFPMEEILKLVADVHRRPLFRPHVPSKGIPTQIHQLMIQCWQPFPEQRPPFTSIKPVFDGLEVTSVGMSLFKRSEDRKLQTRLLNECFPPHIAERLKNGQKVVPEKKPMTTL